jgi:hypothetical protein
MSPDEYQAMQPTEVVMIELTDEERNLLVDGLGIWGGPARGTDELAVAMGFSGLDDFKTERKRLSDSLHRGEAITRFDWARVLCVAEITFIRTRVNRSDWWSVTRFPDDESTLEVLRPLQEKIDRVVGVLKGTALELPQGPPNV